MATVQYVPPIARGYHYPVDVGLDAALFPEGCKLRAEIRNFVGAGGMPAGTLTTEDGGITRLDDQTIRLDIKGEMTGRLTNSTAVLDVVRTDLSPDEWLPFQITLPVVKPVTAPGADA
jgi:hypothetical protein